MNVVLWRVLNVAAIMNGDLLRSQGTIVDITLDVVVGVALVCDHLEECCTTRSWAPQHNWVMCVSYRARDRLIDE